ncbi:MAG TPA: hypothetical protein VJS12_10520, partial [Steroidobacteraceae bacterium]|nr:hypothetical protein [Steroidobacteraceae bacterium]
MRGVGGFEMRPEHPTLSPRLTSIPTSVGLPIAQLEPLPAEFTTTTWVVLVGQPSVHVRQTTPEVIAISHWLGRVFRPHLEAADSAHRLLTVCSGTLLA